MHPRSDWHALHPTGQVPLSAPEGLVVHWEGSTVALTDPAQVPAQILAVQRFHMMERGYTDIAYNWLVDPWGGTWEGRGGGVRSGANGTSWSNDHELAVCVLAGEGDPPSGQPVFDAIAALRDLYQLPLRAHRDVKPTACPGDVLTEWTHAHARPQPHDDPLLPEDAMPISYSRPDGYLNVFVEPFGTPASSLPPGQEDADDIFDHVGRLASLCYRNWGMSPSEAVDAEYLVPMTHPAPSS